MEKVLSFFKQLAIGSDMFFSKHKNVQTEKVKIKLKWVVGTVVMISFVNLTLWVWTLLSSNKTFLFKGLKGGDDVKAKSWGSNPAPAESTKDAKKVSGKVQW